MKIIQPSFAAGELTPSLFARVDLARYQIGAAKIRNFFVDYRGGVTTRPGTEFIGRAKFQTYTRLIKFQFSVVQTYVLEFGDLYIRVIMDGGYALEAAKTITAVTQANPGVITSTAHGYTNGRWINIASVGGMTQLNNKTFIVAGVTANTFTLTDLNGNAIDTTGYTAYTSGGTAEAIYEITTPYLADDLPDLKYTQSADVMTLTHPSYAPRDLTRTAHTAWTLSVIGFGAGIDAPLNLAVTNNTSVVNPPEDTAYGYVVTAVDADGDESVASVADVEVGPAPGAVDSGTGVPFIAWRNQLSWDPVTGAEYYNIYKAPAIPSEGTIPSGAIYGFVGSTDGTTFFDQNITADMSLAPPEDEAIFDGIDDYPGAVTYFQQRRVFARSNNKPQTMWMTQTGLFHNMNKSRPVKATDAITLTIPSQQVNEIKHMVPMPSGLVLLTSGSAFQLASGESGLAPATAKVDQQAYTGVSDLAPLTVGFDILYVQSKGSTVRTLSFDFFKSIYAGTDVSFPAGHLFTKRTVVSWDYAEEPFRIAWVVLDNGQLLSFTYFKDQEVSGWARHDTDGRFMDVCSVPEDGEDAVYFITKRRPAIGENFVQYVEKMASRTIEATEEAWAVDCGLSTNVTYPDSVLLPYAITGSGIAFRSFPGVFDPADVGKHIRVGGGKAVITAYTSAVTVTANIVRDITETIGENLPANYSAGEWSIATPVSSVSGLDHLEGRSVKVLADGFVSTKTVSGGAVTLDAPASMVRVGLGYTCQLQTLPLDLGEPTVQGKMKRVGPLTTRVHESRGLKAGTSFSTLKPMPEPVAGVVGQPVELFTDDIEQFYLDSSWNTAGQICFEQSDPLPSTILGVIPDVRIAQQKLSDGGGPGGASR